MADVLGACQHAWQERCLQPDALGAETGLFDNPLEVQSYQLFQFWYILSDLEALFALHPRRHMTHSHTCTASSSSRLPVCFTFHGQKPKGPYRPVHRYGGVLCHADNVLAFCPLQKLSPSTLSCFAELLSQ